MTRARSDEPEFRVHADELRRWIELVLRRIGVSTEQALSVSDALAEADGRGANTHGVEMLPRYVRGFQAGFLNTEPHPTRVRARGPVGRWDGDNGLGHYVCDTVARALVEDAQNYGIAVAAVTNSNHFGIAARYVLQFARNGLVGFITTSTPPVMAAPDGADTVVGNNPFAWAIPRPGHQPIVLDMAVSAAARGKIRLAASAGLPIPIGWALDADGRPTADASAAMGGVLLPMADYKGFGMAVVNELLSGALSGARVLSEISTRTITVGDLHDRWGLGHFMLALEPSAFVSEDVYAERVETVVSILGSHETRSGAGVVLPGDLETRVAERIAREGVPLPRHTLEALDSMAAELETISLERFANAGGSAA